MDGKVVQLIQGREKALEGEQPLVMLEKFSAFPEIQVIDLDAALGKGSNDAIVRQLAARAVTRVGGGVRSLDRARTLLDGGASKVIVGTAAFSGNGINERFLAELISGSAETASSWRWTPKEARSSSRVGGKRRN